MITNIGKNLIGKYLVGQSTQWASHIAIGSGPKPLLLTESYGDYSSKTGLDFEMARVPVISRSYINEKTQATITNIAVVNTIHEANFTISSSISGIFIVGQVVVVSGISGLTIGGESATNYNIDWEILSIATNGLSFQAKPASGYDILPTSTQSSARTGLVTGYLDKISLIAELPIDNRYEITELALYSDLFNPLPSGVDSKNIFNFSRTKEFWQYNSAVAATTSSIAYSSVALDNGNFINTLDTPDVNTVVPGEQRVALTNSNNTFFNSTRVARQERPRFLDDCLIVGANLSKFLTQAGQTVPNQLEPQNANDYLSISNISLGNIDSNSSNDELVLAYSLISISASTTTITGISSVNIMIEFLTNKDSIFAKYHFKDISANLTATNRYKTISVPLGDTTYSVKTSGFFWSNVISANIYASIQDSSGNSVTTYCLALDGLNLVNNNNLNSSNYGMTAYVPVKNSTAVSIVKEPNLPNLVEFRLTLGNLG